MVASLPYIDKIIATFHQAAEANRQTPGRAGNIVVLDAESAAEAMITGDLHGHRRNFNVIRRLAALGQHPRRHLILQEACHGGPLYPQNGGCMSHTVLEDVALLKTQYPERTHFILGNHELAELTDFPIQKNRQLLNSLFRRGLEQMYGAEVDRVRGAIAVFLRSCPLAVRLPHGVFVCHTLPDGADARPFDAGVFQRELDPAEFHEDGACFRLVWGRDYRAENAAAFADLIAARLLITGHEPCADGYMVPNPRQIILDSCSDRGTYLLMPTEEELGQDELVARIKKLRR